ncbi:hypothetical protein [Sorangium sp. So ce233]|uniref:hypothetical protein n=1 Tax=Sorangium sp. So ce233 TaxID=3133290 RepID=UPI003F62A85C
MTPEERQRVVDALPSEFEIPEASPPEGDFHFNAKVAARDTLGGYFQSIGKRVYLVGAAGCAASVSPRAARATSR